MECVDVRWNFGRLRNGGVCILNACELKGQVHALVSTLSYMLFDVSDQAMMLYLVVVKKEKAQVRLRVLCPLAMPSKEIYCKKSLLSR